MIINDVDTQILSIIQHFIPDHWSDFELNQIVKNCPNDMNQKRTAFVLPIPWAFRDNLMKWRLNVQTGSCAIFPFCCTGALMGVSVSGS